MRDYSDTEKIDKRLVQRFLRDKLENEKVDVLSFHKEWDVITYLVIKYYRRGGRLLRTNKAEYEYDEYLKWKSQWEHIYLRKDKIERLTNKKYRYDQGKTDKTVVRPDTEGI